MRLAGLSAGDLIEVDRGGRRFFALVTERGPAGVELEPLSAGVSYRNATAAQVIGVYRRAAGSRIIRGGSY